MGVPNSALLPSASALTAAAHGHMQKVAEGAVWKYRFHEPGLCERFKSVGALTFHYLLVYIDYCACFGTQDNLDFQSGMMMNINGDDEEMEGYASAYEAMDGEGAVDVSQYGTESKDGQHEQHCL